MEIETTDIAVVDTTSIVIETDDTTEVTTSTSIQTELIPDSYILTSLGIFTGNLDGTIPIWLLEAIDTALTTGDGNITSVLIDMQSLLDILELGVSQNVLNIENTDLSLSALETSVVSRLDDNSASILILDTTKVTASQAQTISLDVQQSTFGSDVAAFIGNIASTYVDANSAIAADVDLIAVSVGDVSASVSEISIASVDEGEARAKHSLVVNANGQIAGFVAEAGDTSIFTINADVFKVEATSQTAASQTPFTVNATTGVISFVGLVTFTGLGLDSNSTSINGDYIQAGTIDASVVDISNINPSVAGLASFRGQHANHTTITEPIFHGDTYENTGDSTIYQYTPTGWISTTGVAGLDGNNTKYQFSSDSTDGINGTWHDAYISGDTWIRLGTDSNGDGVYVYDTGSIYVGTDGTDGIPGNNVKYQFSADSTNGDDGTWHDISTALDLWVRMGTDSNGDLIYVYDTGVAFVGDDGVDGTDGTDGDRGSGFYRIGTVDGVWSDATANSAVPGGVPVLDDIVTIYKTDDVGVSSTKKYDGANWVIAALVIDGDMIATGTIHGNKIQAQTITANEITAGTITATEIDTASITSDVVTATSVNAVDINAESITAGTLTGVTLNIQDINIKDAAGKTVAAQFNGTCIPSVNGYDYTLQTDLHSDSADAFHFLLGAYICFSHSYEHSAVAPVISGYTWLFSCEDSTVNVTQYDNTVSRGSTYLSGNDTGEIDGIGYKSVDQSSGYNSQYHYYIRSRNTYAGTVTDYDSGVGMRIFFDVSSTLEFRVTGLIQNSVGNM